MEKLLSLSKLSRTLKQDGLNKRSIFAKLHINSRGVRLLTLLRLLQSSTLSIKTMGTVIVRIVPNKLEMQHRAQFLNVITCAKQSQTAIVLPIIHRIKHAQYSRWVVFGIRALNLNVHGRRTSFHKALCRRHALTKLSIHSQRALLTLAKT